MIERQALAARIALANCWADAALGALELIDGAESILAIDEAVAGGLALLDEVLVAGDPASQVMAHAAKAQLYGGMEARMLNTVPSSTDVSPEANALRTSRRAIVEALITPWREAMRAGDQAVIDVVKAHPAIAADPVVRSALRGSRTRLVQRGIATR